MSFIELHFHDDVGSNTRLTDTTNKIEPCMAYAASIGLKGLAITDHESLSAHIKALNCAKKLREKYPDFQLILGNEIYLCNDTEPIVTEAGKTRYNIESPEFFHFILLAKDAIGHRQLRELSSRAWSRCYSYKNMDRVPTFKSDVEEIVGTNPGHLIASTACLGGEFPKLVLKNETQAAIGFMKWCQTQFGVENFFIELQPGRTEDQKLFNRRALEFAKYFNIPWIITNDVHYMSADKREMHTVFLQSHDEERETGDFYESTYFKTELEMIDRMVDYMKLDDIKVGFANTIKIGEMCKDAGDYDLFHSTIVPQRSIQAEPVIQGVLAQYYSECPSLAYLATSPYIQDRFFLQECEKGLLNKHIPITERVAKRIDIEAQQLLGISEKLGCRLTSYYNLMQQIEEIIWTISIIGPGRGSACCLYCAYLMDITSVDSLENNLPYWRHTHVSKVSLPDIDIDLLPSKRGQVFELLKEKYGRDRCLNIITFKTETLKSAIKTACRGLGINSDTAQEMSNLVPVTRGRVWTYKECQTGNDTNDFQPVTTLLNMIAGHPGLSEAIAEIEGLVNGRGIHASGFYVMDDSYLEHNSLMKAPSGVDCTCWEMADSDAAGSLKFDLLVTDAVEKIQKCMELLVKDGLIEWQGSLKATYDKYLHPSVIDYTNTKMWDYVCQGAIVDLFQFMSDVGIQAIDKIQPRNLQELATASSIMRLMSDDGESPIERYVRFKRNVEEWYQEMREVGLTEDEINVLRHHLDASSGCSVEQETVMELSMDEHISGFDMSQADTLRKVIGKKQIEKLPTIKQLYYDEGAKHNTRKVMLDYVWDKGFVPQLGYAFAKPHVLAYAVVAIQEMNLFTFYPHVYWQTACLTVNSSSLDDDEVASVASKTTNYGKIATAISNMQHQGVNIALPDINSADFGFKPDAKNNRIIFGLKAINAVGDDAASAIIASRPYLSVADFYKKHPEFPTKTLVYLVKAGCFDELYPGEARQTIMLKMLNTIAEHDNPPREAIDMKNFKTILSIDILPPEFEFEKRLTSFRAFIKQYKTVPVPVEVLPLKPRQKKPDEAYDLTAMEPSVIVFFESELYKRLDEGEQYIYNDDGHVLLLVKAFEKWYKTQLAPVAEWIKTPEALVRFNAGVVDKATQEMYQKYCLSDWDDEETASKNTAQPILPPSASVLKARWEMDALSFYYSHHELEATMRGAYSQQYGLVKFQDIPATPIVVKEDPENKWVKYKLYRICGTVLDKNKMRHTVSLLTPDGVVNVKFYSGAFSHYDKQISQVTADGKTKTVLEKSWFTRGTKLLITGIRRDDSFFPKKYFDSVYQHTVCRILGVSASGALTLQTERTAV